MANKRGLGMGLGALFSETESAYEKAQQPDADKQAAKQSDSPAREIELSLIYANPDQPRKNFTQESLNELADSIRSHGVLQPILLNKQNDGRYMIIAGERRYRAAQLAKLSAIPAIVKQYDDRTIKEISIIENLQREDLNPLEAANAIRSLMNEFSYTQEDVARRLGKSRSAIANTLRILSLPPVLLGYLQIGKITEGHARALIPVTDPAAQLDLAKRASAEKLSVRDLEDEVRKYLRPQKPKETVPEVKLRPSLELRNLAERLQKTLATKVQIIGNDRKGRIFIDYFSRDDLDRINDLLNKLD